MPAKIKGLGPVRTVSDKSDFKEEWDEKKSLLEKGEVGKEGETRGPRSFQKGVHFCLTPAARLSKGKYQWVDKRKRRTGGEMRQAGRFRHTPRRREVSKTWSENSK